MSGTQFWEQRPNAAVYKAFLRLFWKRLKSIQISQVSQFVEITANPGTRRGQPLVPLLRGLRRDRFEARKVPQRAQEQATGR